jgi:hypothetical protein
VIETFTVVSGAIALLSVVKEINGKKLILCSITSLLVIFDGLRWEMGTDWSTYNAMFNVADVHSTPGIDPGFMLYTSFMRNITDNYSVYLLITDAIIYFGIFYAVARITDYSLIALFYLMGTIPWYAGSLRQMIACVFFTLGVKATIDRKLTKFLVLMIVGLMFHVSIMPFFATYWLYGMSWGAWILSFLGLAVVSFFSRNLISILDSLVTLYSYDRSFSSRIGGTLELSNPALGFLRKIYTLTAFIVFSLAARPSRNMDELQWRKIKLMLMLVSLSIIFYYIGTYEVSYVSSRVDIYSSIICASVLIGLLDKSFKSRSNRLLLFFFVLSLVGVFYSRLEFMDLFHPYSSVFYNYDLHRELY